MPKCAYLLIILLLFFLFTNPLQAAGSYNLALFNSPYLEDYLLAHDLNYSYEFRQDLSLGISLSLLIDIEGKEYEPTWKHPTFNLSYTPKLGLAFKGSLWANYDPVEKKFGLKLGLEYLTDPLLPYLSLMHQQSENSLELGIIFAANEKWALGAQVQYKKISYLTYSLTYLISDQKQLTLNYSHSVDGFSQLLGLKVAF